MKRSWILFIVGLILATVVSWCLKSLPRPLRDSECSPLYQRYADDPDIEASFVKGFRVNDTLAIDATLLRAKDSAGWERLREDFEVTPTSKDDSTSHKKSLITRLNKKGETKPIIDTVLLNNDLLYFNIEQKNIAILHITDTLQLDACFDYMIDDTF